MHALPKFSLREVVRIKSQPPARACLIGEWGVVFHIEEHSLATPNGSSLPALDVPDELATTVYGVWPYRQMNLRNLPRPLAFTCCFNEADLESRGEFCTHYPAGPQPEAAARIEVARAIARNQLYFCMGQSMCQFTPGVAKADMPLLEGLAYITVTEEHVTDMARNVWGHVFGTVFNRELIKHMSQGKRKEERKVKVSANPVRPQWKLPKFAGHELVRIKSQPPARACLVGEWGVVRGGASNGLAAPNGTLLSDLDVSEELATSVYRVFLYRASNLEKSLPGLLQSANYFNEADLESQGEFGAVCTGAHPEASATAELARAIARDQLYFCKCKGLRPHPFGIAAAEMPLLKGLPHIRVIEEDRMAPEAQAWWRVFAEVFNRGLAEHLWEKTKS
jgi:hypothetical protein